MNDKSIVFIEPAANKTNVFDEYMKLPLMGSLYLGSILSNHGYDVRIINENILGKLVDPFEVQADVFCITALTVSANRAKMLADQLRKIYPDSLILVGGIHASLLPHEFTDLADNVVIGEAEGIIVDLVEGKYLGQKIVRGYPVEDLDTLPVVDFSLLEGSEKLQTIPIMSSRGCPFDCNFCTVTKIFGKKFRMQSVEKILNEIESIQKFFGNKGIFFYDDNFSANKKRIHQLCDRMKERKMELPMAAQVRADVAKDENLLEKMSDTGFKWVYVGFESINDEILKTYHKSQTRADIENAIRGFHRAGINVHGMFMFGADQDNTETIRQTVDFAIRQRIDTVQFMILTPFPGTRCYEEIESENRLIHTNWDYYNGMFAVSRPKLITATSLIEETHRAYKKFYSVRRILSDTLSMLFNLFLDAFVWNFKEVNRYSLNNLFLRAGANTIVTKYVEIYGSYIKYLESLDRQSIIEKRTKAS